LWLGTPLPALFAKLLDNWMKPLVHWWESVKSKWQCWKINTTYFLMSYKTLTQIRSNKVLNCLKVAHEVFTWNGRKYHIVGRYGGHKWHGFWLKVFGCTRSISSQYKVWASKVVWSKHKYEQVQQNLHKNILQAL
jgi:hypothetical protein